MRDIKFKFWHRHRKFMAEVVAVDLVNKEAAYRNPKSFSGFEWVLFDDIELMQSTGMEDKNRIEIYEGDIFARVKHGDYGAVKFIKAGRWVVVRKHSYYNDLYECVLNGWEVVGNIYENKGE